MKVTPSRYDHVSMALHWLTAMLVGGLWLLAQGIDLFPPGAGRVGARSVHIVLGMVLGCLIVLRLVWRRLFAPAVEPVSPGLMGRLATYGHWLLYAALFAVIFAGLVNTWVRGDSLFGIFHFTSPAAGDRALRRLVGSIHALTANFILILAGLHAAMALLHHFIIGDETLRRMLPLRWAGNT